MDIAVLIVAFNRPDLTLQVFGKVRQAKPAKLFICFDAPRDGRQDDVEKNEAVKKIFEAIDWECEVYRNYAQQNMGCDARMASGISWAFEHTGGLIIFEDDCVPDLTFFTFCQELLERYKDDPRIGVIAGHIEHFESMSQPHTSYYVNRIPITLGWATWRRVWQQVDMKMEGWPQFVQERKLYQIFPAQTASIIERFYQRFYQSHIPWDCAFGYAVIKDNLLCIHPYQNLITNIGFAPDATHTTDKHSPFANVPTHPMSFPLKHPASLIADESSEWNRMKMFKTPNVVLRAMSKVLRSLGISRNHKEVLI